MALWADLLDEVRRVITPSATSRRASRARTTSCGSRRAQGGSAQAPTRLRCAQRRHRGHTAGSLVSFRGAMQNILTANWHGRATAVGWSTRAMTSHDPPSRRTPIHAATVVVQRPRLEAVPLRWDDRRHAVQPRQACRSVTARCSPRQDPAARRPDVRDVPDARRAHRALVWYSRVQAVDRARGVAFARWAEPAACVGSTPRGGTKNDMRCQRGGTRPRWRTHARRDVSSAVAYHPRRDQACR